MPTIRSVPQNYDLPPANSVAVGTNIKVTGDNLVYVSNGLSWDLSSYSTTAGGTNSTSSSVVTTHNTDGTVVQSVFTLTDLAQAVVNGTEYQGTKIYDFPQGRILVLGVTASIAQKTTSALASTLNASSTGALGIGTATASSTTLASTMVDLLPSTAFTSSATINVAGTAVGAALAASAHFDGTTTAKAIYVNTAYATTTDVDADATQTLTGTVTVTWVWLGDF